MATTEPRTGANPPYGPFNTFTGFLKELGESAVPPFIDGSLFRGKSGTTQSELRSALRFFGLVTGEKMETTDSLRELVAAQKSGGEVWTTALSNLLWQAYALILDGVDLKSGTRGQLDEAFREKGGVTGSVNRKAVRFFLNGITEVGGALSPHFGAEKGRTSGAGQNGGRKGGRVRQKKAPPPPDEPGDAVEREGTEVVVCSIPNGRTIKVAVPSDLTAAEEKFLIAYLQGFFALKPGRE